MLLLRFISAVILSFPLLVYNPSAATVAGEGKRDKVKWIVQKTSTLSIAGHTNINRFSCEVDQYTSPDTILCAPDLTTQYPQSIPLKGVLRINIVDFNCGNRMMTAEFKTILKYKQYPQLTITFVSLEKMPSFSNRTEIIKGWVEVELVGISRRLQIDYTSGTTPGGEAELVGCRALGFSDFQLTPPSKMAGLVRVADQLGVQFHLYLKQVG